MTPYPVKYETLDPVVQTGGQMYSDSGHCPPQAPPGFSWPRPWHEPQSPPQCPAYSLPFYSPPLPHFNAAKLVRNTIIRVLCDEIDLIESLLFRTRAASC